MTSWENIVEKGKVDKSIQLIQDNYDLLNVALDLLRDAETNQHATGHVGQIDYSLKKHLTTLLTHVRDQNSHLYDITRLERDFGDK